MRVIETPGRKLGQSPTFIEMGGCPYFPYFPLFSPNRGPPGVRSPVNLIIVGKLNRRMEGV